MPPLYMLKLRENKKQLRRKLLKEKLRRKDRRIFKQKWNELLKKKLQKKKERDWQKLLKKKKKPKEEKLNKQPLMPLVLMNRLNSMHKNLQSQMKIQNI
jgi:hypothetical protein